MDPCCCVLLPKLLLDPRCPLKADKDGFHFTGAGVEGSKAQRIAVSHCFWCGGILDGAVSQRRTVTPGPRSWDTTVACTCIVERARDPFGPIRWDPRLGEFQLRHLADEGTFCMHYCPWCGTPLPESKRASLFTEPTDPEIEAIRRRLEGARTASDVISRLGEPDREWPSLPADPVLQKVYGMRRIVRQLDYDQLGESVRLCVQEHEDGTISWSFTGKPRAPRR